MQTRYHDRFLGASILFALILFMVLGGYAAPVSAGPDLSNPAAGGHPPTGFRFHCAGPELWVSNGGVVLLRANIAQLTAAAGTAVASGRHQFLTTNSGASLWALNSNEVQAHWDYNPDATKVIVSAQICASSAVQQATAAYSAPRFLFHCTGAGVQISYQDKAVLDASFYEMNGPLVTAVSTNRNMPVVADKGYSLWALKSNEFQVHRDSNPDGTKLVVASGVCGAVTPPPAPPAPAPPPLFGSSSTSYTATSTFSGSTRHVVQRGENLFRISLRYGRSMASIAAANGISNYNLIYAGQTLIIP